MTQQNMPNVVELYEGAVQYMAPVIGAITPERLEAETPCAQWNVRSLINHQIRVAQYLHSVAGDGPPRDFVSMYAVDEPLPPEGAPAAFETATNDVLKALKVHGALEKMVGGGSPSGAVPIGQFAMFPFADLVIHRWDLAKATGQDAIMDSSMSEAAYNALLPAAEGARGNGAFGPEVSVPISASIQDRLLGLTGRQP